MNILNILTSPWAIIPEKLCEIQEIYLRHSRDEKIDIAAIEAKIGKPLDNKHKPYQVVDNVAIIPIHGVMSKRMNLFSDISGGVSTELIARDFKEALNDSKIETIVLYVDSPGGTVDGTMELAEAVFNGKDKKRIVSFSDGLMASAAYWVGSAAHEIYISSDTVEVGSIGVVTQHVDYSKAEEKAGIKTTEIYSGKYKRIASPYKPLSQEGHQYIQAATDYLYSVFVDKVAEYRGVDSETVLQNMADGKLFIGKQSIAAGLVNGISTLDNLINAIIPGMQVHHIIGKKEVKGMNLEELKEKHPDLLQEVQDLAKAEMTPKIDALKAETDNLKAENAKLKGANEKLSKNNDELEKENKDLGKRVVSLESKDIARDKKDAQKKADEIFNVALNKSKIASKHYKRVMRGVSFDDFYKDNQFDQEAYAKAVDAEIKDWEEDIEDEVLGSSHITDHEKTGGEEKAEDDLVNEMVSMVEKKEDKK